VQIHPVEASAEEIHNILVKIS